MISNDGMSSHFSPRGAYVASLVDPRGAVHVHSSAAFPGKLEDVKVSSNKGLDRATCNQLASCRWIGEHLNVLISGATGVGKSYLACALGQAACRRGREVFYYRLPRLFEELALAKAASHESLARDRRRPPLVRCEPYPRPRRGSMGHPPSTDRPPRAALTDDRSSARNGSGASPRVRRGAAALPRVERGQAAVDEVRFEAER
ncbi:MAG TPA: ATP-binding protein [Sandaracinaceae bacterium LLY-WYZ-13_1]|nr:ATP-binding protein [Sandaracinaceae bacterium LLY-WYZ-13_1]